MPLVKDIVTEDGKSLKVFDDAMSHNWHHNAYLFVKSSMFGLGWGDNPEVSNVYLHSSYSDDDIANYNPLSGICCEDLKSLIGEKKIIKCVVNLTHPTDTYFYHTHKGTTLLIYNNQRWSPDWAGETMFYNRKIDDVICAVMPTPRRAVLFDGEIPHSLRPHSVQAYQHRFTTAIMFDDYQ